jgi:hypothetical protein
MRNSPSETEVLTFGYGRKGMHEPYMRIELNEAEWLAKLDALKAYDHDINWGGRNRPTWEALIEEYGTPGRHFGFDLKNETYDNR